MKAKILFIRKIRDLSQYIYIGLININEICIFIYIMIKISFFPYKYKHVVVMC